MDSNRLPVNSGIEGRKSSMVLPQNITSVNLDGADKNKKKKKLFGDFLSKFKRNNTNNKNFSKMSPQELGLDQVSEFEILQRV